MSGSCWACWSIGPKINCALYSYTQPICLRPLMNTKKNYGGFSAHKAALGGLTKKTGYSRWFIGYKNYTLRLWLSQYSLSVLLVPLMSWAVPANRGDALFLWPSLRHCAQHLRWIPNSVIGDSTYLSLASHRRIREELQVAVVSHLRSDMLLIDPYDSDGIPRCL